MTARILAFAAVFCLCRMLAPAQQHDMHTYLGLGSAPDAAAAKLGEPLYKQNCAACHGEDARGAQGPNLVRSTLVLHDEKGHDIGQVVKSGRPEGGMPAFPNLTDQQIYDIAEYLHVQVENAANRGLYNSLYSKQRSQTTGDPTKGRQFFAEHCASCHSATGDLAKIADKFPEAAEMQERFLWPASREPRRATVTTASGQTISGTILKIDDFDVSLRDAAGQMHEWPRDQVEVKLEDKLAGHRALLPVYKDADLHNLTAYLLTLK
ncbi:MAG TPA: c-type cytochrome [Bryobacteraceae bacterium]|nr:c-type cytochrome [Bryobacteraceae bacterium]